MVANSCPKAAAGGTRNPRLKTTVIGSYPKPCYCKAVAPDWFEKRALGTYKGDAGETTAKANAVMASTSAEEREEIILQATSEILKTQTDIGVDVPTDGEVRRENYIHHFCRSIENISFENLTRQQCRPRIDEKTGETVFAFEASLPTIVGKVGWRGTGPQSPEGPQHPPMAVVAEWKLAQARVSEDAAVKYTLPGPMTIIGTIANKFYTEEQGLDEEQLARDLGKLVKECVDALVQAGCTEIQIDEPLFARRPEEAIRYGISILGDIVQDVPGSVFTTCHICCGYPNYLDQTDYLKADNDVYVRLAPHLAKININGYSLEGAHRPIDWAKLAPALGPEKTVVLGCVKIASSKVDTVDEIADRLADCLQYVPMSRVIAAPDCGLAFLSKELAEEKLKNMVEAAGQVLQTQAKRAKVA